MLILPEMPFVPWSVFTTPVVEPAIWQQVVATANRRSYESDAFAGQSWIVSPEGNILAETTADAPIATVTVDLADVAAAKQTYPRNLPEP
jgi:predicted amidohydrolase